jgi:type IV fimbrial biogenesis protein FimT
MRARTSSGFTLAELMVVIAIMAILVTLAIPSFTVYTARAAVDSHLSELRAGIRLARHEALKRGRPVTICQSSNPMDESPDCSSGAEGGWASGWIIFLDRDGNQSLDGSDVLIRAQQAFQNSGGIFAGANDAITFLPSGLAVDAQDTFTLYPPLEESHASYDELTRRLCINATGGDLRTC